MRKRSIINYGIANIKYSSITIKCSGQKKPRKVIQALYYIMYVRIMIWDVKKGTFLAAQNIPQS